MVTIQVDEQTAKALEAAAAGAGLSLPEYIKTLVPSSGDSSSNSWEAIEREITDLSVDGSLPASFSRAELYSDHD
jgi:hypothetical protein